MQWLFNSEINDVIESKNKIIIPSRKDYELKTVTVTAEDFSEVDFILKNNVIVTSKVSNCYSNSVGMRISINRKDDKLIFEHKPPFRACDQSVFIEKANKKLLLFNASDTIPASYEDTRAFSLRELYKKFISSIQGENQD